uniref:Uncharacterized protein n=1 Tax=Magallana gigas TaxID=29159 RepID=A0A8W8NB22_MAGGI
MKGSFFVVLSNTFLFTFFTSCTNAHRNGNNGCGGTDWSADDQQCYRCMPDAVYWQTARSSCQRLGADLVTINNAGTQTFIEKLCPDGVYWIGLNDISNEGTFLWVSTSTPGYTGKNCETDVNECQSSPCIHGNCSDLVNEYRCQCFPGYEGLQCQIDINECLSSPCGHGSCIDKVNSFVCECTFGYKGISCDEFNTLLLLVLLTFLPIIMLIFSFYLSKRIKHNKVEDVAIFVFPDILRGESKPKLVFQK